MRALHAAASGLILLCVPLGIADAQADLLGRLHRMLPTKETSSGDRLSTL